MNKKTEILNVPKIQKEIKERHGKFIKEYALEIEKVSSDHRLFADIVLAKLNRIALIFKEENVVDDVKVTERGMFKQLCLSKVGYDTYVIVVTNGLAITFEAYTYSSGDSFSSDIRLRSEKFVGVDNSDFDWVDFSKKLLDCIHATIYDRKEVVETRIEGMFREIPKDNVERKMFSETPRDEVTKKTLKK